MVRYNTVSQDNIMLITIIIITYLAPSRTESESASDTATRRPATAILYVSDKSGVLYNVIRTFTTEVPTYITEKGYITANYTNIINFLGA
jgi:hypothetical protein